VRLPNCGGEATFKVENGQANLKLSRIQNCSNFDIVGNDGVSLQYDNKKIGQEGNRSGSFTLPRRFIDLGVNGVKVIVRSNSGKTKDELKLVFIGH
jgi:hypothetical protein